MSFRWMGLMLAVALTWGCAEEEDDEVTAVTIEEVSASEVGSDYEAIVASATLTGSMAQAVESDAALTLLGEEVTPEKARGCTDELLDGTTLVIDYDACPSSKGTVTIDRLGVGEWIVTFDNEFSFFRVDVDGTLLVSRSGRGEFDVMTAASDGSGAGTTPLLLTWEGRTGTYTREVVLTGAVLSRNSEIDGFQLIGEGTLEGRSGREPYQLGLGGRVGESKDMPLLYPTPLEERCASGGALHLDGIFTTPLEVTTRFEIRDRVYDLLVETELDIHADIELTLEDGVIGAIGVVPYEPLIVPDIAIERALDRSTLPASVQRAIRDALPEGVVPYSPLTEVETAVNDVLLNLSAESAFCPASL